MANTAPMLMHSTYFSLGLNNTPDVGEAYMAEALQYLSNSPGLISFWIGRRADDMVRPENDLKYDIAMHQIFANEDAFNLYNKNDTSHEQFVTDVNRWTPSTTRRVLDTYISNLIIGGNSSTAQHIGADGNMPQSLFHSIYFSLVDKSAANVAKLTDICAKCLAPHPGIQLYCSGGLTAKKAYDDYLKSKLHDEFFPATKGMIDHTYIFDSYLKYESKIYSLTR